MQQIRSAHRGAFFTLSAAVAMALACLSGCSPNRPPPTAGGHASIPATQQDARELMRGLDQELAAAQTEPAAVAAVRERLRGRLLAADLPAPEVDAWSASRTQ